MGVRWVIGNGGKIRFWEDQWLCNTCLAILFRALYVINEQHGKTVRKVWNGEELQLSFRRGVSERIMDMWEELKAAVENIELNNEEDHILWTYSSSGKYSVQSLYAIVNHRGVVPIFVHVVWKLNIPSRVQFFLLLLSNNKVLTRDNLAKRRELNDPTCLFCNDKESFTHLFFQCYVASNVWKYISGWLNKGVGVDFESVASLWIANKKYMVCNIVTSTVIWVIWKLRNSLCFQGVPWSGMKKVFVMVGRLLRNWLPMFKLELQEKVEPVICLVKNEASLALRIKWTVDSSGSDQSIAQPLVVSRDVSTLQYNRN